jgi:hypothetical protein
MFDLYYISTDRYIFFLGSIRKIYRKMTRNICFGLIPVVWNIQPVAGSCFRKRVREQTGTGCRSIAPRLALRSVEDNAATTWVVEAMCDFNPAAPPPLKNRAPKTVGAL